MPWYRDLYQKWFGLRRVGPARVLPTVGDNVGPAAPGPGPRTASSGITKQSRSRSVSRSTTPPRSPGRKAWQPRTATPPPPPKRQKPVVWSKKFPSFTKTLVEAIRMRDEKRILERQQADNSRHWEVLQQRADSFTLLIQRNGEPTVPKQYAQRSTFRRCIRGLEREQRQLSMDHDNVGNTLETAAQMLDSYENDLLHAFEDYSSREEVGDDEIRISGSLRERFRDALEISDFLDKKQEDMKQLKQKLDTASAPQGEGDGDSGESLASSTAQSRTQKAQMAALERAMPARRKHRQAVLDVLCNHARAALLEQGKLKPELEDSTHPVPIIPCDDAPGPPPQLDPEVLRKYEGILGHLRHVRDRHESIRSNYASRLAQYLQDNPAASSADFDKTWYREVGVVTDELKYFENAYFEIRDEALRAGAEPLDEGMAYSAIDHYPPFAGHHPHDGTVGCMAPEALQRQDEMTAQRRPAIMDWIHQIEGSVSSGQRAEEDPTPCDTVSLAPWDSASAAQINEILKAKIDDHRQRCGTLRATFNLDAGSEA